MQKTVNGIIKTPKKHIYGILDFLHPTNPPIVIGTFTFPSYVDAVMNLHHRFYPISYLPYLLAVQDLTPTNDTWNNLVFAGHAQGIYDNKTHMFQNVRAHDMNAVSDIEVALIEALASTYACLKDMVQTS